MHKMAFAHVFGPEKKNGFGPFSYKFFVCIRVGLRYRKQNKAGMTQRKFQHSRKKMYPGDMFLKPWSQANPNQSTENKIKLGWPRESSNTREKKICTLVTCS